MHYIPKKTLNLILENGCNFCVQVKKNCNSLYKIVEIETGSECKVDSFSSSEKGHGRQENRCTELFKLNTTLPKGWKGITHFARVHRFGTRNGKSVDNYSYYVLSHPNPNAKEIHNGIRNHWGIENTLHWIKDATMREDHMRASNPRQAACIATLNSVALNIFQLAGIKPTKLNFACYANRIKELYNLFQLPFFA